MVDAATVQTPPLDVQAISPGVGIGPTPEPLGRLGNYAAAGVCAVAAYSILFLVASLLVYASGSIEAAIVLSIFYLIFYLVLVVAGIPFIAWTHRAYKNLPLLGVRTRFSPNWAIACWFLPFANWVIPGLIGGEIWRAGEPRSGGQVGGLNLARAWWGACVGSAIVTFVLWLLLFSFQRTFTVVSITLMLVLVIISASLAIAFVHRASKRIDALSEYASPGDGLDRAIVSIDEALPIPGRPATEAVAAERSSEPRDPEVAVGCPQCGAAEEEVANFCGSCGTALHTGRPGDRPQQEVGGA